MGGCVGVGRVGGVGGCVGAGRVRGCVGVGRVGGVGGCVGVGRVGGVGGCVGAGRVRGCVGVGVCVGREGVLAGLVDQCIHRRGNWGGGGQLPLWLSDEGALHLQRVLHLHFQNSQEIC